MSAKHQPAATAEPAHRQKLADMETHAEAAARLLQALSNPWRLMLLCVLSEGELSVGDLNQRVALSQSALSQHLGVLRRQQLVATRRASQTIYYSIRPGVALEIVGLLHAHFCQPGDEGARSRQIGAEAPPTAKAPSTTQLKPKGD